MISAVDLTAKRHYYLEYFTRFEYSEMFEKYKDEIKPLIAGLEKDESLVSQTVRELIDYADSSSAGFFRRSIKLDDFQRFFTLYLVPASRDFGEIGERFAAELCRAWCERFPKHSFTSATYKDIAENFRTKPFGMN